MSASPNYPAAATTPRGRCLFVCASGDRRSAPQGALSITTALNAGGVVFGEAIEEDRVDMWDRDDPHDLREGLFGGHGRVRVWNLVHEPQAPFAAVLACELEPSASVGVHVQEYFPEVVIGVEGVGSVEVDGVESAFGGGSVVELPLGRTLAIRNVSATAPLRYLIVKARSAS